jgi:hypothetical protein
MNQLQITKAQAFENLVLLARKVALEGDAADVRIESIALLRKELFPIQQAPSAPSPNEPLPEVNPLKKAK